MYNDTVVGKNEALIINKSLNYKMTPIFGVMDLLRENEDTK